MMYILKGNKMSTKLEKEERIKKEKVRFGKQGLYNMSCQKLPINW